MGPPPGGQELIKQLPSQRSTVYPSGDSYYLRREIATVHGIDTDQILVGNGANEVITFVIKAFCEKGANIITADKTFAVYEWVATFSGIETRIIPLIREGFYDQAMLKAIDERTKILSVCNPNNPRGKCWSMKTMTSFLEAIDGKQIVVIDEAYFEFVEEGDFPNGMELIG